MVNKYTYRPPFTEKELFECYVTKGMSQQEVADLFHTTQHVVWRAMRKMGVPTRVAAKRNQYGAYNSSWKGGRVLQAQTRKAVGERSSFGNGYYYLRLPDHPNATKAGYVAEHIVVATEVRGHPLEDGEMVHHINLNKHDNRTENLIISTAKEHATWHTQLEEIAASLLAEGKIGFDPTQGYLRI